MMNAIDGCITQGVLKFMSNSFGTYLKALELTIFFLNSHFETGFIQLLLRDARDYTKGVDATSFLHAFEQIRRGIYAIACPKL